MKKNYYEETKFCECGIDLIDLDGEDFVIVDNTLTRHKCEKEVDGK